MAGAAEGPTARRGEGVGERVVVRVGGGGPAALRPIAVIGHGVTSIPDCIAEHRGNPQPCSGRRSAWEIADPAATVARGLRARKLDITVADLNDYFCSKTTCFAAIGGVIAYFDGHHISATYARTLAPYLDKVLTSALLSRSPS